MASQLRIESQHIFFTLNVKSLQEISHQHRGYESSVQWLTDVKHANNLYFLDCEVQDREEFVLACVAVPCSRIYDGAFAGLRHSAEHGHTGSRLLLASASQDKYVRIWAVRGDEDISGAESPADADSASMISR